MPLGSQLGFALTSAILIGVLTAMMRDEPVEAVDRLRDHPRVPALGAYLGQVFFMTGTAFVVARTDHLPADPETGPGHIVKARYTPMQQMLLAVDEQDSPHHADLADADDLAGMPVVVADLHSALPAVLAGIRSTHPHARVAYVMTDGGALPAAFSRAVAGLADAGWLASTITVGQAFGGDHEAVTTHTGLLAARYVVGADVAVVTQGPGNVGTGTRWGLPDG